MGLMAWEDFVAFTTVTYKLTMTPVDKKMCHNEKHMAL